MATLAQRVAEAAKPHGSLRKAALSWGLPVRSVYEWGSGSALPGRTACAALAPILGLTASELVALVDAERLPQPPIPYFPRQTLGHWIYRKAAQHDPFDLKAAAIFWGFDPKQLRRWAHGEELPLATDYPRLATALGMPVEQIASLVDAERHPQAPGLPAGSESADAGVGPVMHAPNATTDIVRSPA